MKAVYIVDNPKIAKVLVDPMRRAILTLLSQRSMTQAQLASELGLTDASLNYHMKILRKNRLVIIAKRIAEEHGILQKFFAPTAYLFVYDLDSLPKDISRYFYPVSLERARAVVSLLMLKDKSYPVGTDSRTINSIVEALSRHMVNVSRSYTSVEVSHGQEAVVYEIYTKAIDALISQPGIAKTVQKV